ncbi:hypothetical protein [Francisella frigiditurris]|uniref:Uncharacterized protein n=1 Tax=Francisella frigiditurris TaxID=1542390 RepID=A0A1J0KRC2_9GAMM|nr:hypothetical protein [Francisella frigiditurris]APC96304.1 hypothetical protein KX01_859 [Francisella frigiditurris]
MYNKLPKNLENLYINISLYYKQESGFVLGKLNDNINYIDSFCAKKITRKIDIYNLVFIIEEIRYSTNYLLSSEAIVFNKLIEDSLAKIEAIKNYDDLYESLKILKIQLSKYKIILGNDFSKKLNDLENKSPKEIISDLKSRIPLNKTLQLKNEDILIDLYIKAFKHPESQQLIQKYKDFFSELKSFTKTQQNVSKLIPLNKNPILSLLRLAYFIKNGANISKPISSTDSLLLKAFLSYEQDLLNLELLNNYLNLTTSDIYLKDLFNENNDFIKELKDTIDFGIFSSSQYFSDFKISNIFFPENNIAQNDKLNNLDELISRTHELPNLLLDIDTLYKKLNTQNEIYHNCFIEIENESNIEKLLKNSPAKILSDIANKYFSLLLDIATSINIALAKKDFKLLEPFIRFEDIFRNICQEVSVNSSLNSNNTLRYYISSINKTTPQINQNHSTLLRKEDNLVEELSNNIISDDIYKMELFLAKANSFQTYKKIATKERQSNKEKLDIEKSLKTIDKDINNNKIESANTTAKRLTNYLLKNAYYNVPKLISIRNLPPSSNKVFSVMQNISNDNAVIRNLIDKQDLYWST